MIPLRFLAIFVASFLDRLFDLRLCAHACMQLLAHFVAKYKLTSHQRAVALKRRNAGEVATKASPSFEPSGARRVMLLRVATENRVPRTRALACGVAERRHRKL
jgi:hypothetical protein